MYHSILAVGMVLAVGSVFTIAPIGAQSSIPQSVQNQPQHAKKPINNMDIIRMVNAGFSEAVILNAIQTNENQKSLDMGQIV